MSRRVSLPGADELFRTTGGTSLQPASRRAGTDDQETQPTVPAQPGERAADTVTDTATDEDRPEQGTSEPSVETSSAPRDSAPQDVAEPDASSSDAGSLDPASDRARDEETDESAVDAPQEARERPPRPEHSGNVTGRDVAVEPGSGHRPARETAPRNADREDAGRGRAAPSGVSGPSARQAGTTDEAEGPRTGRMPTPGLPGSERQRRSRQTGAGAPGQPRSASSAADRTGGQSQSRPATQGRAADGADTPVPGRTPAQRRASATERSRESPQGSAGSAPAPGAGGVEPSGRPRRKGRGQNRRPSGRERHDEKITVYVSAEELMDLEQARLALRGEHGMGVDRGRIVREAVAVVLADLESRGEASILVRRLRGR